MHFSDFSVSRPYEAPTCRICEIRQESVFLASDGFGGNGYPGQDLDPGDEFDF